MSDLQTRIDQAVDRLSPAERVVAEHLRQRPDDVVLFSSTELARRTGVSKATVSRLLRSLGWNGAQHARTEVLAERARGVPVGYPAPLAAPDNLRAAADALTEVGQARIVAAIVAARRIVVVGFRNSFPVALHLRQQLAQARPGVALAPLPGQTLAEELVDLEATDLVIAIGFRRRPAFFGTLMDQLRAAPVKVLAIVDPSGAEHLVGHAFGLSCPIAGTGAFDSYEGAMALVAQVASAVQDALGERGRARAVAIAELYRELGEVEDG
ncbi:putative RpiR family transcriptional regulator [Microlunatus phosphovorus NM-1]|uniref:Putative RpiR family transcriptional regulator n=1 Tax=Microlunatus phosphovorus (strain ATCC 700054 / DSM 10555 / JCM 9379 / NBRC 101784 / NCIMB 13414 / VKM Ac-1990 / NM-1) TaxID=1032480 RepID=F5XEJ9_MICPN|nr:helix-turn-helix domain-containing protein [Microlunatus phosphovorus]NMD46107.1 MurR/RpiR family transcriptional regulator [Propionibacterium sp.]BAK35215.1 putative RpiR family transcriptional regulator [Microlunatus phosphovorus NM-1]